MLDFASTCREKTSVASQVANQNRPFPPVDAGILTTIRSVRRVDDKHTISAPTI